MPSDLSVPYFDDRKFAVSFRPTATSSESPAQPPLREEIEFAEFDGPPPEEPAVITEDDVQPSPVQVAPRKVVSSKLAITEEELNLVHLYYSLPPFPKLMPRLWQAPFKIAFWLLELAIVLVSPFAILALLAAVPIVNFLALGYMLEAEGRVARTGKLRYAIVPFPLAHRLGGIALGTWIWCWFVLLVADAASDAEIIAPGSGVAVAWRVARIVITIGVATHIVLAIARGGRLGLFFWPTPLNGLWLARQLMGGDYIGKAGAAVREFITALRLRHHFWLGLRGFFGAFAWLVIPTALFAASFGTLNDSSEGGIGIRVLITLFGSVVLVCVLSWAPFLQAGFAADHRLKTIFNLRQVRALYRKTPIAFLLSVVVMYALALPLYLFTLFETPPDMRWLLTPIFVVSIYPARIFVGWAYSWAQRKQRNSWLILRLACTVVMWPLLLFYCFLLFFTPDIGAAGTTVLFQHHALLLPWPF